MRYGTKGRSTLTGKAMATLREQAPAARELRRHCASGLDYDVSRRGVSISSRGHCYDPVEAVHRAILDSLDPVQAPGKVTSLAQMSPEKRAEMERLYGGRR